MSLLILIFQYNIKTIWNIEEYSKIENNETDSNGCRGQGVHAIRDPTVQSSIIDGERWKIFRVLVYLYRFL